MNIDAERCIGCGRCLPYCPVAAITIRPSLLRIPVIAAINQETCVECGECKKSAVCPTSAHIQPELSWPRVLRAMWSDPIAVFPKTQMPGRGTQEMKTNDVTNRFQEGEVGIGVELGRPGVGATLADAEKVSIRLAALDVSFEEESPWTDLIDKRTGAVKDTSVRSERVLSCIVECKAPVGRTPAIFAALMEAAKEVNTVFTIDIISRCRGGEPEVKPILDAAGIRVRPNGKTNIGLGRLLQ
jgi:NAD-dependent dihydropyrimidine dehydrogenase PreA subunit